MFHKEFHPRYDSVLICAIDRCRTNQNGVCSRWAIGYSATCGGDQELRSDYGCTTNMLAVVTQTCGVRMLSKESSNATNNALRICRCARRHCGNGNGWALCSTVSSENLYIYRSCRAALRVGQLNTSCLWQWMMKKAEVFDEFIPSIWRDDMLLS